MATRVINQTFNYFNQAEKPGIYLCNPDKTVLYQIDRLTYDTKITLKFNAISEFSFKYPRSIDGGNTILPAYEYIKPKRLIYVQDIGYFEIVPPTEESSDGSEYYMDVQCESLERELMQKSITDLKVTSTRLFNSKTSYSTDPSKSIIGYVLKLINGGGNISNPKTYGGWYCDPSKVSTDLLSKYRSFDISNSTIYNFLMTEVEKAFECVFLFDTINKEIIIKTLEESITYTDVYLSFENLLKETKMQENTDDLVTALHVYGGNDLNIASVNPIGGNIIYNFDYFKNEEWMSSKLITLINRWEEKIEANREKYTSATTSLYEKLAEKAVLDTELSELYAELAAAKVAWDSAIQSNYQVAQKKAEYDTKNAEYKAKLAQVNDAQAIVDNITAFMKQISSSLSINSIYNFPLDMQVELSRYMIENTYTNDNISMLDNDTGEQIIEKAQSLYDQSVSVLGRSAFPRYEFTVDSANFIRIENFLFFTNQIPVVLGAEVIVESRDYPVRTILLELSFSYDDPEDFSMTFSNRLRLNNTQFEYADLVGQTISASSTITSNQSKWSLFSSNYQSSVDSIISSYSNVQTITPLENKTVSVSDNAISLSKDGWETSKTILGEIDTTAGKEFGVNAEYIFGKITANSSLEISNEALTFKLTKDRAELINPRIGMQSQRGGSGGIMISPELDDILLIGPVSISGKEGANINVPNFRADKDGNIFLFANEVKSKSYQTFYDETLYTGINANVSFLDTNGLLKTMSIRNGIVIDIY